MSMAKDDILVPALQLENGAVINGGWYNTELSKIDAVYALVDNELVIKSDGDVTGSIELDILSDAPEHYDIMKHSYTGTLEVNGQVLQFENNYLKNAVLLKVVG